MRNKRGQVIIFAFMLGLTILILALALSFPVKETVMTAMNVDNLDCTNSTISIFDKTTCVVTDLTIFHFIGGLIFVAGAVLAARIIFT